MATNKISLPKGFVLDQPTDVNLPKGFMLDKKPSEPNIPELMRQLRGRLPGALPETQLPLQKEEIIAERGRQSAFPELLKQGYDVNQIKTILDVEKRIKPSFLQQFKPKIGQTAGGITGGIAGPLALGQIPPFTALPEELVTVPLTAALGAGLGGAGGKAAQIGIEESRLPTASELFGAAGEEAVYEVGGRYATMGLKRLFGPLIKKTVPEAAELMARYGEDAIHFSPAEMDKRLSIRLVEAVSRGSWGTDEMWAEISEKQVKGIHHIADLLLENIAEGTSRMPPEKIGSIFAQGILEPDGQILRWMDDLFNPLYKQVDELTKGAVVKTNPLKQLAKNELRIDARMMKGRKEGLYLTSEGRNLLNIIMNLKDEVGYGDMRLLRTRFLEASRKLARDLDSSKTIAKRMATQANKSLFEPENVRNLTPEAKRLLENTNRLYKTAQEGIEKTFPEAMAKRLVKRPANVVKELFPPKNPEAIRMTRIALTEPVKGFKNEEGRLLWNQLRQAWYADLIDKATKEGGLSKVSYYNALQKMGDNTLNEMFSPKELEQLYDIGKAFKVVSVAGSKGTPLFTKGIQITGAYKMYTGVKEDDYVGIGIGATLALGPVAFARLAMNPKGVKALTMGLELKPGSSELGPIVARMIGVLREEDQTNNKIALKQRAKRQRRRWIASQKGIPPKYYRGFGGRGV